MEILFNIVVGGIGIVVIWVSSKIVVGWIGVVVIGVSSNIVVGIIGIVVIGVSFNIVVGGFIIVVEIIGSIESLSSNNPTISNSVLQVSEIAIIFRES